MKHRDPVGTVALAVAVAFLGVFLLAVQWLLLAHRDDGIKTFQPDDNTVIVHGQRYDRNDQDRPACFMEPSNTQEGYEVVFYPHLTMHRDSTGFEVKCP